MGKRKRIGRRRTTSTEFVAGLKAEIKFWDKYPGKSMFGMCIWLTAKLFVFSQKVGFVFRSHILFMELEIVAKRARLEVFKYLNMLKYIHEDDLA